MTEIPHSESLHLTGGKIGVLLLHGFTGSPASIRPWALSLHEAGFTVRTPRLAGHGTKWSDLNETTWSDWYQTAEREFVALRQECDRIFVAGFSMGGALALRLAQIRGSEMEGLLLLNPSIFDDRKFFHLLPIAQVFIPSMPGGVSDVAAPNPPIHGYGRIPLKALNSLRKLWKVVEQDLYLVDVPMLVGYSLNDHVVSPACSQTVIDNSSSEVIREVIFEKSFHNVSLDYESEVLNAESISFIRDILTGQLTEIADIDEKDLIDAEFFGLVSGLSLDESTPNGFLDELDVIDAGNVFIPPNPVIPPPDQLQRAGLVGIIGGLFYLALHVIMKFDFLGLGAWPGILGFIAGVGIYIWRTAKPRDEFDDGAVI